MQIIDGALYAQMLVGGAASLSHEEQTLNDLNVFPVADGDTGTNMRKTLDGGLAEIHSPTANLGALCKCFSRGMLLSARGNSGVILSQIFAGISEGLADCETADAKTLAFAYQNGIKRAYGAVQTPVEGTILTVFRESAEYAKQNADENTSIEDFFKMIVEQASRSLAHTKELLSFLAEADVVDSGGAGYLAIAKGMLSVLLGEEISYESIPRPKEAAPSIDLFTKDSEMIYGYCTECLLRLTANKTNPDTFSIQTILDILNALKGESIVAYKEEDVVKVHVHTLVPGEVLTRLQQFGEFLTVKIENMHLAHTGAQQSTASKRKKLATVAVGSGDGICALFSQMGASEIVSGGQTANPSTEEFLQAFEKCDAENILVFPNNKNVVLAASQAAALYSDSRVYVIESYSPMQGYCALSVVSEGVQDIEALVRSANRAAKDTVECAVTQAVRDACIDGIHIKKGAYMALCGKTLAGVADTPEEAALAWLQQADTDLCELITLFCGKSVSLSSRDSLCEKIEQDYADCELLVYEGGQDVYDYYLCIE